MRHHWRQLPREHRRWRNRSLALHAGHGQELERLDRAARRAEVRVAVEQRLQRLVVGSLQDGVAADGDSPADDAVALLKRRADPSGVPRSTIAEPARCAHSIHAAISAFPCSGVLPAMMSAALIVER